MNGVAIFILAALLLRFGTGRLADMLNLGASRAEPPPPLKDLYDQEKYRESQAYLRASTRFGILESSFSLAIILVFWLTGGFNFLDNLVSGWGFIPLVDGLLYFGIIFLIYGILTLPFEIYDTFVIEQRFGFNRTTARTFITDRMKTLVLAVIIGGALLSDVLALFQYTGGLAWVYCWIGVTAFSVLTQFVAPAWIMPLFNKFTPMVPGELRESILAYTRSVSFPVKNISVMDGSRRSSKSNAFFTGFGSSKRIALFDTLIDKHTTGELVAVLAHEVGHYKKKHTLQSMVVSILYTGLVLFLFSLLLKQPALYQAFNMDRQSIYTGIIFFALLYTPVGMVFSIIMEAVSRKNELSADRFAAETTGRPQDLSDALKKLSATNLANLTPHPLYVFLNYSHPPLLQRLQALEKK